MTDHIPDQRVVFYLRNQDLIETWAGVRKDVIETAHDFYLSLADDLARVAPSYGEDVAVWVRDGPWSNVGLYRQVWYQDGAPLVAAAIEWNNRSTFIDGPRIGGLRVNTETEAGRNLRPHVGDQVRGVRSQRGFDRKSSLWPAYRDLPRPMAGSYWENLSEFRIRLIREVTTVWEAFADLAEQAISNWSSSAHPTAGTPFERPE